MHISCKCLNIMIYSRGSIIDNYDFKSKATIVNHPFFSENIGCVEVERVHKKQPILVATESLGDWVIHKCLNCGFYTHALNNSNTAVLLINKASLTKPQEISSMKNSDAYSPVFHIVIDHKQEDNPPPFSGLRLSTGTVLHQQLTEWLQHETALTEEKVRQYTEQQYALLDTLHRRAHKDHHKLSRILAETRSTQKDLPPDTAPPSTTIVPAPLHVESKKSTEAARKPSVDAEGLFDLDGMDDNVDALPSDEELSDTDESGSHDEGVHIPRRVSSGIYAKSLPVNIPTFMEHSDSDDLYIKAEHRVLPDLMDIAASIKALAKSVHGDAAVFGDLPRPRFSSQI